MFWFVETPFALDDNVPTDPLSWTVEKTENSSIPFDDELPPVGGVTYLSTLEPRSSIVWRLLSKRHILELRRVFVASAPADREEVVDDYNLPDPKYSNVPVRLVFPAPILQTPSVQLSVDARGVQVMVVTSTGILYRIFFPLPNILYEDGWRKKTVSKYVIKALRPDCLDGRLRPVIVQFPDADTIVVGCTNGALVKVTCPAPPRDEDRMFTDDDEELNEYDYHEYELGDSSFVDHVKAALTPMKTWFSPLKRTTRQNDFDDNAASRQPIAMSSVRLFSFILGRDRNLRIWDLERRIKWRQIALPLVSPAEKRAVDGGVALAEGVPRHYIQVFDEQEYSGMDDEFGNLGIDFKVAIHVPPVDDADAFFAIYLGRIDRHGAMQEFEFCSAKEVPTEAQATVDVDEEETLVDFVMMEKPISSEGASWSLWGVWNKGDRSIIRYTEIYDVELGSADARIVKPRWVSVIPGDYVPIDPPSLDGQLDSEGIDQAFLKHIFYPGVFSIDTITRALARYRTKTGGMFREQRARGPIKSQPAALDILKREVRAAVHGAHGSRMDINVDSDASVKHEWINFLEICLDVYRRQSSPVAIDYDAATGSLMVMKRGILSAIRECDPGEVLNSVQTKAVESAAFTFVDRTSMERCVKHFGDDGMRGQFLAFLQAADWLLGGLPRQNIIELEDRLKAILLEPKSSPVEVIARELGTEFFTLLEEADNQPDLQEFTALFGQLHATFFSNLLDVLRTPDPMINDIPTHTPNSSAFTNTLLATSLSQVISSRYHLMRDLLLTLVFAVYIADETGIEVPREALANCVAGMYSYFIAKWMAEETVKLEEDAKRAQREATTSSGNGMNPELVTSRLRKLSLAADTIVPDVKAEPLSLHLLQQHYLLELDFGTGDYGRMLRAGVGRFIQRLGLLTVEPYVRSCAQMLQVANKLIAFGHADAARELVFMLPKSPAIMYLRGRVFVEEKQWEKAEACFDAVPVEFGKNGVSQSSDLAKVLPDTVIKGGVTEYYRDLMHLFERKNNKGAVVKYAKQAMASLSEQERTTGHQDIVNKLWRDIFRFSVEINDYDEAYNAAMRNPDQHMRLICLRNFVTALCQNKRISDLCEKYPFPGYQDEVELELIGKLRKTPVEQAFLAEGPNYHRILYTYYITRSDHLTAASIMYEYARKINQLGSRTIGLDISIIKLLQEQCRSYLAAINALSSVSPEYAWIVGRKETDDAVAGRGRKRRRIEAAVRDDYDQPPPSHQLMDIIQIPDIRQEYTLALAKLNLHRATSKQMSIGLPSPEDALALYVQEGRYDDAITLGLMFGLDLTKVFESMGDKCVWLGRGVVEASDDTLTDDPPAHWEGTASEKAWRTLRTYLELHDGKHIGYAYRKAVVDRVLNADKDLRLPIWLTSFYKTQNPDDLVRVYLKHDLVEDAAKFMLEYIAEQQRSLPKLGSAIATRWLPYALIDQMIERLQRRAVHSQLAQKLRDEVERYIQYVGRESESIVRDKAADAWGAGTRRHRDGRPSGIPMPNGISIRAPPNGSMFLA